MTGALIVAMLVGCGTFLLLQRNLVRVILGFVLLGHAVNVTLLLAGGTQRRGLPLADKAGATADPLPQAFVLTAIVITFAVTAFLVAVAVRQTKDAGSDDLSDDGALEEGA